MTKAEYELQVFLSFAATANLNLNRSTARSERPPKPDVWCEIDGIPAYFELRRVADQTIANDIGFKSTTKGAGSRPGVFSYSDDEVVRAAVAAKASKSYETEGQDFELLLYCDRKYHPRVELVLVREALRELESEHSGRWNKIWLYDVSEDRVLWPENA